MMKREIYDEIKSIAPRLVEIGNNNPFVVPAFYFENLESEFDFSSKENNVPDSYFENLSNEVLSKARAKEPARVISINKQRWVAAASVVLLCVASYFTLSTSDTIEKSNSFAMEVELEEAFEFLTDYDDIFMSEVEELSQIELFDEEGEYLDADIDYLLDEVTLDDLDDLL